MKRHFPPLHALRAFEATARLLSFQQAAQEMNVTHSAISHQIKKLETELGKPLFERLGRSIALTDEGQRYFNEIHLALNKIEFSTQEIFGEPDQGDLIVQVYMGIASRWLVPRIGDFRTLFPGIHIELSSSYQGWDFDPYMADLGIIYTEKKAPGLIYQRLFKGTLIPVCSPDLFDVESGSLDDLLDQPFLTITESPNNLYYWLQYLGVKDDRVKVLSEHDNHLLTLEAAIAGEGVAIVHSFFASGDLASGKLIKPTEIQVPEQGAWYLIQSARNASDSKIARFSSWLHQQIAADQSLGRYQRAAGSQPQD
ncbi:LysR substrate-binding domain-containing protein [Motiliproteus sp. MSK22-1]|uniref:LysR substrate-binding domain-containing protein n=1 Tax=Motiliproteus sp. MSK22-1 TaxID=1897630 RepID=UPI000975EBFB|nr:LysR substrate-binding domain-containing protein [Motiliproteus sp. MSK22-1]OMH29144.1 hypothetical protein BGP75_20570 [Motiliproteus sp. MSK22-1]